MFSFCLIRFCYLYKEVQLAAEGAFQWKWQRFLKMTAPDVTILSIINTSNMYIIQTLK
jgi:hypothetical protein